MTTATKKNTTVQPNGTVTATFDIPTDFDTAKVTVYYVSKDGQYEELETTVDATTRKATATLKHFSTYVVAEKTAEAVNDNIDNAPTNNDEKDPISPWVIAIIIVGALAVIAVAVVMIVTLFDAIGDRIAEKSTTTDSQVSTTVAPVSGKAEISIVLSPTNSSISYPSAVTIASSSDGVIIAVYAFPSSPL